MKKKIYSKLLYWIAAFREQFNFFSIKLITTKPIILHILHSPLQSETAGTEKVTRMIIDSVRSFDHAVVVIQNKETTLYFNNRETKIKNYVTKDSFKLNNKPLELHLGKIVRKLKPEIIDIQNLEGYPISIMKLGRTTPLFVHLHDFGIFYPTPAKFNFSGINIQKFLSDSKNVEQEYFKQRKAYLIELSPNISGFISVSPFVTKVIKETFLKEIPVHTIENATKAPQKLIRENSEKLRIAFLGLYSKHKGSELFRELVNKDTDKDFEWSIIGKIAGEITPNQIPAGVMQFGEYKSEELPKLLSNVDIVLIPSQVTESYNLTLSEALENDCFPIVTDSGALGFRLKSYNVGAVYSNVNFVKDTYELIKLFHKNRELFNHEQEKLREIKLPTAEDFRSAYEELYNSTLKRAI